MGNNAALTAMLIFSALGTLYFLAIWAKAVMRLVGLVVRVLLVTLLVGMGYVYLSRTVDKYEPGRENAAHENMDRDLNKDENLVIETVDRNREPVASEKVKKI